jgi:ParB family transcriptional regulator, chromosome partitioning protein
MAKKAGLGRGLESLLGEVRRDVAAPMADTAAGMGAGTGRDDAPAMPTGISLIPIGTIRPHPDQPRRFFAEDALNELADSIAQRGVIQPIVVRAQGAGYQIIAGERRWRAAQRARLHEIPAIVRDFSDSEALEIALIENIQRQDLSPVEEAEAYHRLMQEFGHTQVVLAKLVDKSRSHIANLLRLLDLPEPVRDMVTRGVISMGHARAMIGMEAPEIVAEMVRDMNLSVRDVENMARAEKNPELVAKANEAVKGRARNRATKSPDFVALEQSLSDLLGIKVAINPGVSETDGEMALSYKNLDQLDMILQRLSGDPI